MVLLQCLKLMFRITKDVIVHGKEKNRGKYITTLKYTFINPVVILRIHV